MNKTREEQFEYFNLNIKKRTIAERQAIVNFIGMRIGIDKIQTSNKTSIIKTDVLTDDFLKEIITLLDKYIKDDLIDFSDIEQK